MGERDFELDYTLDIEPEIYEAEEEEGEPSPPEKVYGDAYEKGFRRSDTDFVLSKDWLRGWLRGASVLKGIALEAWLTGYLRGHGVENAEEVARAITAATMSELPNVYNQYVEARDASISRDAITALNEEVASPTGNSRAVADVLSLVWDHVRRDSKYYISMSAHELEKALTIIHEGRSQGMTPDNVARWLVNEFRTRSPRSVYFNVYYVGKVTGDEYIQSVARALGRVRS